MGSLAAIAVQASLPFAAFLVTDPECRWRGLFGAGYAAALLTLGAMAVDPLALQAYAAAVAETSMDCLECIP